MNVATTSNDLEELLDANDDDYFANLDYWNVIQKLFLLPIILLF